MTISSRRPRVLLIQPFVTRPEDFSAEVVRVSVFFPLGIAYLAATLEKEGYDIMVLDALAEECERPAVPMEDGKFLRYGLTDEELTARIRAFNPDIVGASCLFAAMLNDAARVNAIAKSVNTNVATVMGGAHAGANPHEILSAFAETDYVVSGEGEDSMLALVQAVEQGKDPSEIDGLAMRKDGGIHFNPKSQYIHDLDRVPFPARHLFNMQLYFSKAKAHSAYRQTPFTPMITSRGCPAKCSFCALGKHWGQRQRMRSAENVLDEIEHLVTEYGVKEIHFEDDNLTANKQRALDIFNGIIDRGLNISWNVPSGMAVYTLRDEEVLEKMAASGCYSVSLAIENGNQRILRELMNKPVKLEVVPEVVKNIRKHGMDARGFFILGYPGETKKDMRRTIEFARNIELDWAYFFTASPLPHTKMWQDCIEKGYIKEEDFDPIRSFHQSIIRTPEFTPEELAEIREEAIISVCFKNNPNLLKYDAAKAAEHFNDVAVKYPHFDFAHFYEGEAHLRLGDTKAAATCYRLALKANPDHAEAKDRLADIEK